MIENVKNLFREFTPEIIKQLEVEFAQDPEARTLNRIKLRYLLPFLKKAMPRIGINQNLFGFGIICLEDKPENEKEIVEYGIEPLIKSGILTPEEAQKIVDWFLQTKPDQRCDCIQKDFTIEQVRYRLVTYSFNQYFRNLDLVILSE